MNPKSPGKTNQVVVVSSKDIGCCSLTNLKIKAYQLSLHIHKLGTTPLDDMDSLYVTVKAEEVSFL